MNNLAVSEKQIEEILNILSEECAEVIQMVSKINRFGLASSHPADPNRDNRDRLMDELGDLTCMINLLLATGLVDGEKIQQASENKRQKLKKWSSIDIDRLSNSN